jgi:DNA repair protein RadC
VGSVFPFLPPKENTMNSTKIRCDALDADLLASIGVQAPLTETQLSDLLEHAKQLLLRRLRRDMSGQSIFTSPDALADWLRLYCADLQHEVFVVLFLDTHLRLLDVEPMFRGTVAQTAVYPREVVKAALARNATAVAFAHNHPAGVAEPSRADELMTATLKTALALVDVRVIDHFIVAGGQVASFSQRGLL